ncbi:MAG: JDVT-CTERM system CAAX-type protease [Nitrospira sp.]|nr:JDVT-CTERM system CAAX-type protease [Nitrospira sp.]
MQGVPTGVLPLPSRSAQVRALLGLQLNRPFYRDSAFLWLVALGPIAWLLIIGGMEFQPLPWHVIWSATFLSIALWQPLSEELLFRGVIQGQLLQTMWGRKTWVGLSMANLVVSLLFVLAHLASHSVPWSLLVFLPSLCFGFVRDRFGSVYPSIALHAFYNAGYFLLVGGATFLSSR